MVGADDEGAGRWDDDWDDDWEEGWDGEWEDDAALEDALAYQSAAMDETALVEGGGDDGADEGGGPADGAGGRRGRSLLRASALPAVGTTLSRVTGLIRVGALTAALGLTTVADVYNLANTTPNILYELVIGGVLSSTLVPLFVARHDDKDRRQDDVGSVIVTVSFVAIVVPDHHRRCCWRHGSTGCSPSRSTGRPRSPAGGARRRLPDPAAARRSSSTG